MPTIKKILVPIKSSDVSLSGESLEALSYVNALARESSITVYLMTVIDANKSIYDAYKDQITLAQRKSKTFALANNRLEEAEQQAKNMGIKNIVRVTQLGKPHQRITKVAADIKIDLIIMGTHGHPRITRLFAGSVSDEVIMSAPCPVLVVRSPIRSK